jgi:FixJ family two-component response regulator
MPTAGSTDEVFIVDDDKGVRDTLSLVFVNAGYQPVCFSEGSGLLAAAKSRTPVCILLDVNIPGKSGLDILKELNAQDYPAPIFIISGHGDIAMAVDAIKNGALDFIEKPFRGAAVVKRIQDAMKAHVKRLTRTTADSPASFHFPGREPLTGREQDVLSCLVAGASNKDAARQLGISPRTVEVHRARIMEKLGAKNATDLIRIVMTEGSAR